ncbi:hypothetical protein [Iningainema tapete]|uniref:Uncharacterized protein n=1 Tax=Iningainema tapete BLCC-T55 TaxID=2748662 RepID=A0A8J7C549_9CYAN|nr:hypothetical protein [Iningainema tapete]MBD2772559.1 hypothetical protein [Iningainema tapete BLCC-T55]
MNWLTPEQAVSLLQLSISPATLSSYPNRSQKHKTTEERFQELGLLFDRDRWSSGASDYLALLYPKSDELNDNTSSDSQLSEQEPIVDTPSAALLNDEVDESNDDDSESKNFESETNSKDKQLEPYIFEKCTVKLTITFLPDDNSPEGRKVILAASSHGDFPVNKMLREKEMGELPASITDLLNELIADFPNRQVRRAISYAAAQKKTKNKQSAASPPIKTQEENPTSKGTQLTLFGV